MSLKIHHFKINNYKKNQLGDKVEKKTEKYSYENLNSISLLIFKLRGDKVKVNILTDIIVTF